MNKMPMGKTERATTPGWYRVGAFIIGYALACITYVTCFFVSGLAGLGMGWLTINAYNKLVPPTLYPNWVGPVLALLAIVVVHEMCMRSIHVLIQEQKLKKQQADMGGVLQKLAESLKGLNDDTDHNKPPILH